MRKLDKDPENESLKTELKNLNERIRYHQNKIGGETPKQEAKKAPVVSTDGKSIRQTCLEAFKAGMKSRDIATKYNFKYDTVCWYRSQNRSN